MMQILNRLLLTAICGVIGFSFVGCNSNTKTENELLKQENEELRSQYQEAVSALNLSDDDITRLNLELRSVSERETNLATELANRSDSFNMLVTFWRRISQSVCQTSR